ncbi:unnamed protein product [Musa textilis]
MATVNPFDLLGDDDSEDFSQLLAAQQQKIASMKAAAPPAAAAAAAARAPAKLPTKPLPPAQAVREAREVRNNTGAARGGAGRGGFGRGRGGRGGGMNQNSDFGNGSVGGASRGYDVADGVGGGEHADSARERERAPQQPFSGGRRGGYGGRGGYGNGEAGGDSERPPRRIYERRSGTGRGYEMKRNGAGRGNWGNATDETVTQLRKEETVNADDKTVATEKQVEPDGVPSSEVNKDDKEGATNEMEEDKEMTLEEYEKLREEKRKALLAMKNEERKVEIDEELQSMKQLSVKKGNDDVFVKLGSDKDIGKKKENADRDERIQKSIRITEFLKPAEGERYYSPGGRGRGRGRGGRGQYGGGYGGGISTFPAAAPSIEDPGQFPTLGGK